MKTNLMRAAQACAALAFASTAVMAQTTPVPGVDVVVHSHGGGKPMMYTTTQDGTITVRDLTPGEYEIEIVSDSLVKAIDKIAPQAKAAPGAMSALPANKGGEKVLTIAIRGKGVDTTRSFPFNARTALQGLRIGFTVPSDAAPGLGRTVFLGVTVKY